jgi:hypothetical protein
MCRIATSISTVAGSIDENVEKILLAIGEDGSGCVIN